jgi:hypothetical protein
VLKRHPSDALLLIVAVAVIALVLTAVMVLEPLVVSHGSTLGSLGVLHLLA